MTLHVSGDLSALIAEGRARAAERHGTSLAQGSADLARSLTATLANGPGAAGAARPRGLLRRWFAR